MFWSFLSAFLRSGAAVFVLPLIIRSLPEQQIGLWYTFSSIGGLVLLLDLGIGQTSSRSASYFWGGARSLQAFGVKKSEGPENSGPNIPGLLDLIATLRVYYRFIAFICFLLLSTVGGYWIWKQTAGYPDASMMRGAYLFYCVGNFINITGSLWPSLLVGINEVRYSEQLIVFGLFIYYIMSAAGLLLGFGLWSLVTANFAMYFSVRWLGHKRVLRLVRREKSSNGKFQFDLLKTLWPNAWRLAGTSLGAYLIINANTLVCTSLLGLDVTASYGLTLQIVILLVTVSRTWLQVKIPVLNQWRFQGRSLDIARLFASRLRLLLLTYILGALAIMALGPTFLHLLHARTELLPTPQLVLFLIISLLEINHASYAALVMTDNRNPFLLPALVSGVFIVAISLILTPRIGTWGLIISQGLVQLCFNNWWTILRGVKSLDMSLPQFTRIFFLGK